MFTQFEGKVGQLIDRFSPNFVATIEMLMTVKTTHFQFKQVLVLTESCTLYFRMMQHRQKCGFILFVTGTADFVPAQVTADQTFTMGSFESLGATVAKANAWIAQQPLNINIVNVQSLDYKVDRTWG